MPATHSFAIAVVIRLTVQVLTVLGLSVVVSSPAHAEEQFSCTGKCSFTDTKGDAPKKADIRGGRVENRATSFYVKFKVTRLPRHGAFVVGAGLSGWGANYLVVKNKGGIGVAGWAVSEVQVYPAEPCPSAHVTWNRKKDVIKAELPHECAGSTAGGGSIVNGIDFESGNAKDSAGHVYYQP